MIELSCFSQLDCSENNGIDESREKKKKMIEARSFYRTNLYIHMNKLKLRKKIKFRFFFRFGSTD